MGSCIMWLSILQRKISASLNIRQEACSILNLKLVNGNMFAMT